MVRKARKGECIIVRGQGRMTSDGVRREFSRQQTRTIHSRNTDHIQTGHNQDYEIKGKTVGEY